MTPRTLLVLSLMVVALGTGSDAYAERLNGNYRGPEDSKAAETNQGEDEGTTSDAPESSPGSGDSGDDGGGISGGGEGGSGDGDGDGESSAPEGGSDIGGGNENEGGASAGSADDGGGGLSAPAGGGTTGGRGKGGSSAQDAYQLVSYYFEHNREAYFFEVAEKRNSRVKVPAYSSVAILGMLPRDERQRNPVTPEDRERMFDILKSSTLDQEDVVRDTAVLALGKLGTPAAVEVLKQRLEVEPKRDIKQDTLLALGLTRSPEAIDPLLAAMKDRNMTSFALLGLGLSEDQEKAAPAVLKFFKANVRQSKKHVDQLASAAMALGNLRYEEAVADLEKAVRSKNVHRMVRVYSAHALGRIGGEDAQKALERGLKDKDQQVRRSSALALGNFADKDLLSKLAGKDGVRNPDPLGAGYAAVSMAHVMRKIPEGDWKKSPDVVREMALAVKKNKIKAQYGNLALAIFGGFDNECRRFYAEELPGTSLDPDTKSSLVMAAGLAGMSSAQPMLSELAGSVSSDPKLGSYAAMSYGMVSDTNPTEAAKRLREVYERVERDDVRRGAVLALGLVGDRKDVPFLIDVIQKTEDNWLGRYTRGAAVVALGLIRDGESVAKLHALLSKPDPKTRAYAVAALGYLADKDASPAMPKLFANNNFREEFDSLKVIMRHL